MIQIGHDKELAQKLHAEELAKSTARQEQEKYDFEKALELQKQLDEREEGGYKLSHFKGMKYEDIRPIFERVWDQNQAFVPKDSEIEKEVIKRSDFIQKQSTEEEKEKKKDEESSKQFEEETASKPREDKDKRQKKQDDPEKLMEYVEVISDSEEVISVTPLAVKSLIVGWKSYCKEDVGYYEIHREDGSYKTYIFFSQMLNDFDREDLIVLYTLFNEKYASTRPGFDDLMLWGGMKIFSVSSEFTLYYTKPKFRQQRYENVSKLSNDSLLARVLDFEKTKTTKANEIASLKRRVKKLKKKRSSRTHKLKRLYKVGLSDRVESSGDEEDLVVDATQVSTAATTVTITTKEITLDQALEALKTSKPKVKGIVFQEPEPVKPMKKKDQISFDEEVALKLQAEFDEERLAREKAKKEKEANVA
ncbi:hypothetical protein Tco_1018943 [Tanacetum coccineum]|uniref:Uncharacterized protein n=1 Tax=Tanacetum coccineum TaxID=301880 RepID=A0ABQ5FX69_9ASTR